MSTTAVTIEEYLATSYHPDCDYVDGELQERNLGERDHSYIQAKLAGLLLNLPRLLNIYAFTEQRLQVAPSRFRIPDVCATIGWPPEGVFRTPPFVCIEILSPDDRVTRVNDRFADYFSFGVPYVFLIDPATRRAWRCTPQGMSEVQELRTEDPEIVVLLGALFE